MATKSAFVSGKINEDISTIIWEPDTDIRTGVWAICLQKIVLKFAEKVAKETSICVKTNLVEQNERDKHGNLKIIQSCLGLFSCKGDLDEEKVYNNQVNQFFTITKPENELVVQIENPLTKERIKKTHTIGCYFIYKRLQ